MLPDEVRKAVEIMDRRNEVTGAWNAVRDHLLAREAEVDAVSTELRTMRGEFAKQFKRAERAEALLRELRLRINETRGPNAFDVVQRVDAHLSENSRG